MYEYEDFDLQIDYKITQQQEYFTDTVIMGNNKLIINDPVHKFFIYLQTSAKKLIYEKIVTNVDFSELGDIIKGAKGVKNVKYKNPEAFVLGYSVTKCGCIDKKKLLALKPKIKNFDPPLKLEDVIRYANLWLDIRNC